MNLNHDKIRAYIGFATKSGNIILGTDRILTGKHVGLILVSKSLSSSAKMKLKNHASKNNINYFELEENEFFELFKDQNIKAVAITQKELAEQIYKIIKN